MDRWSGHIRESHGCPAMPMSGMSAKGACSTTSKDVARGDNLVHAGRYVEARAVLLAALDAPQRRGSGSTDLACLLNLVAYVELPEQRPQLAVDLIRRALTLPSVPDPVVAVLTSNLAGAFLELNQLDSAETFARQAVSLSEVAFGSGHPEVQFAQARLAVVHVRRREYARAEPVLRRILHTSEQTWGESSYEAPRAATNLALVHFEQRQYGLARLLLKKSLAGLRANAIRARDEIALTEIALAATCAGDGRKREAGMWLERALASAEKDLSPEHPSLPVILERAAVTRFHMKEYASGTQLFDRAIALLQVQSAPDDQKLLDATQRYASLLPAVRDNGRARRLEESVRAFVSGR